MLVKLVSVAGVVGVALMCSGLACATEEPEATATVSLGVAAAPSLSVAFTDLIQIFKEENPGVRVHLELGQFLDEVLVSTVRSHEQCLAALS